MPQPVFDTGAMLDALRKDPAVQNKDEPGFATQFDHSPARQALWNYGAVLPVGAAAAALWYLNRRNKKKQQPPAIPPAVKLAAVDWSKLLENIKFHLPKLRIPDTAAGMLAGAGAGGLYDLIRGGETGPDGKKTRRTGQRMLTGALAGAGLANLVGDRARRYVSNKLAPLGYRPDNTKYLRPKSVQDFVNAAILDKPSYDQKLIKKIIGDIPPSMLSARHEIVRRTFGLPLRDQANAWWQKNQDGTYSLNEKSPEYMDRLRAIMGPKTINNPGYKNLLRTPEEVAKAVNTATEPIDLMSGGTIVGGQQLPLRKLPDGTYQGQVLDRFDLTPEKRESDYFWKNLGKWLTDSKWRGAQSELNTAYNRADTNAGHMKTIAGRWAWDNILGDELPWISQKFQTTQPGPAIFAEHLGGRAAPPPAPRLQFLKADNTPATVPMDAKELDTWASWRPQPQ